MEQNTAPADFRVVRAEEPDIPALAGLLGMLFKQEEDFSADPEKQGRGLRMIITNPSTGIVFVLKRIEDGSVVGTLSLLFTISTAMGGHAAIVEDLILLPEYRRLGLGSLLLKEAADYAESNGILRLSLLTDSTNTDAISFYERNGFFRSDMKVMRKYL